MLVTASLGLPPSIFHFGLGFSQRKSLTTDKCLRMNSLSEESSILDHTNNQTGKPWTTPNTNIHGEEQRLPPLIAAMKSAMKENPATFQFPGHNRGFAAPPSLTQLIGEWPFLYDVGELDDLFTPEGPILEAQRTAAEVFGASETWFLVGGTTCGVLAAIMGTCSPGDVLIVPRNCHISAISALALCGAIPKYVFPDYDSCWDAPTLVSPLEVEKAIKEVLASEGKKPAAVFITSPTYHGICSNVKEISTLCHFHGIPLIVDEAHGAHFGFHPQLPISALQQGADLVIQSTHKVLLSLTQSSMLHKSHTSLVNTQKISKCLQILQSTSPSFLLLASLDATTAQLKHNPKVIFDNAIHLSIEAKNALQQIPGVSVLDLPNSDPLRVTVGVHNLGISGYEARNFLYKDQRLLPVLTSSRAITFLFTPGTCREHVDRLVNGFKHLSVSSSNLHNYMKKNSVHRLELKPFMDIDMRFSPREAFFAKKKKVNVNDCVGKVCGELICPYPPGIPVMIPGEVISEKGLSMLLHAKAHGAKITGASNPLLTTIVVCDV